MKPRVKHRFGGSWTEIKLKALAEYLDFYQKALRNKGFETWYIDAFAGTGERHTEIETGGIFEQQAIGMEEVRLDGSARKALKIDPPFAHYWFSEQHHGRAKVLDELRSEFAGRDIVINRGEANQALRQLFSRPPWSSGTSARKQRGVVFLDPYGMSVNWATLELLAHTKRVDVWYLFPRKAVVQQLAHDLGGVDQDKRRALAEILGGDDWEREFYQARPAQTSLFDQVPIEGKARIATPAEISAFAKKRFGTIFGYVSDPIPLIVKGSDFFELYCFSNNPPAFHLIQKGVDFVVKKYTPASRRKSGL